MVTKSPIQHTDIQNSAEDWNVLRDVKNRSSYVVSTLIEAAVQKLTHTVHIKQIKTKKLLLVYDRILKVPTHATQVILCI